MAAERPRCAGAFRCCFSEKKSEQSVKGFSILPFPLNRGASLYLKASNPQSAAGFLQEREICRLASCSSAVALRMHLGLVRRISDY
jgi:hypothetical protein